MNQSIANKKAQVTACTMDCPDACSLVLSREDEDVLKIKGNPDHPITAGFTCSKIKKHLRRLQSPDRILQPMLRDGSDWKAVSWDTALDLCAQKIQQLRGKPKSILHIHGSGAKGVLKEGTALFFNQLGTSRTWGSLCDAAGYMAYIRDFGSRLNNDITDIVNASSIVNWGKDLSRSSIHTASFIRQAHRNGTKVVTISPGDEGNRRFSDQHIRIRPGTDRFLAAALIHLFIEQGRIPSGVLQHTKNSEKFISRIMSYPLQRLMAACDVQLKDVEQLFEIYADDKPVATVVGTGLQRYRYGGENVRFINAVAMISGNIGISGGGSYFHMHSYRNLNLNWLEPNKKQPRRSFPLGTIGKDILAASDPAVKMIWINCINIVNQAPDSQLIIKALERVDFKVVVDAFWNDTAQQADLVLPSKLMLEQEDIIGSFLHDYVHYVDQLVEAPGEAKDDYWILSELGRRLEPPVQLPDKDSAFRLALESPYIDTSLEQLRHQKCVCADRPAVAYEGLQFNHRDKKYRFPLTLHTEPEPPPGYPLRLLTLVRRQSQHSQMLPNRQRKLPEIWIAPDCPVLADLNLNNAVDLVSPLKRLKVNAHTLPGLHPEAVLYRRGDWISQGGGANQLIEANLTDIGFGAAFYQQYVNLENAKETR